MFDKVSSKLKMVASIFVIIGSLASFISSIVLFTGEKIAVGIVVLICGIFLSWVSALLIYGFGELIEKASQIEKNTRYSATQEVINGGSIENNQEIQRSFKASGIMSIPKRKGDNNDL